MRMDYDTRPAANNTGSRWATDEEFLGKLTRLNMQDDRVQGEGLPMKSDGKTCYVSPGNEEHAIVFGSTGSGKSRRLIMPQLMSIAKHASSSVVVTDVKGELYRQTSGIFAKNGYKVLLINLRDPRHSHGFSIMHNAKKAWDRGEEERATQMLNDLAATMFPITNIGKADPFWAQASRELLSGFAGMMVETSYAIPPDQFNLWGVQQMVDTLRKDPEDSPAVEIAELLPQDSIARHNVVSAVVGTERTTSNILVSYQACMAPLYSTKSLINMLSTDEVNWEQLATERTIIYICLPDEKTTLHGVGSLIVKQSYEALIDMAQRMPNQQLPIHVSYILDEFANLPPIPDMGAMISAARSRNINFTLIVQGLQSLTTKYGTEADTIKANCATWFFLTSRESALLNELSTLCGTTGSGLPLVTTSQLQRLDKEKGEALVLYQRQYPYVTTLADISAYPDMDCPPVPLPELKQQPVRPLDLDAISEAVKKHQWELMTPEERQQMEEAKKKKNDWPRRLARL